MDFVSHLRSYLSEEEINKLLDSFNESDKHACLLNPQKMDDATFLSLFPHVIKHPFVKHAYIYDKNEYPLGKTVYHDLGCFYLQEPSAMLPTFFLNPSKDDLVLDLCAAPGGKTIQASFLMENEGTIIANDLSHSRVNAILENVERLGLGNVVITNNDFSKIYKNYQNYFDKIILDAPCSGSGMFRKDDKMKDDWSYQKVLKNQEIQKELILIAYSMLKEGGLMVYSTCSYSKEEDEDVIQYLLDNTDASIMDIEDSPLLYKNPKQPLGVHLFPHMFLGEGHYICLIKKPGNLVKRKQDPKPIKSDLYIDERIKSLYKFGDTLFGLTHEEIPLKGLNIIRLGVKIGEYKGKEFRYDYHYSHFIKDYPYKQILTDEDYQRYIQGYELNSQSNSTYIILIYINNIVNFAKSTGGKLKNYYPKRLRY